MYLFVLSKPVVYKYLGQCQISPSGSAVSGRSDAGTVFFVLFWFVFFCLKCVKAGGTAREKDTFPKRLSHFACKGSHWAPKCILTCVSNVSKSTIML